ncbi:uncharacterized protein [Clytia hemisphaerica]|uniref:uncharacterized protein isoform X1 n=1 Tax=Clytia hemisphaerica TaxID=252671 RepID=UPI0034D7A9FF
MKKRRYIWIVLALLVSFKEFAKATCPAEFFEYQSICYHRGSSAVTHAQAQAYCTAKEGSLLAYWDGNGVNTIANALQDYDNNRNQPVWTAGKWDQHRYVWDGRQNGNLTVEDTQWNPYADTNKCMAYKRAEYSAGTAFLSDNCGSNHKFLCMALKNGQNCPGSTLDEIKGGERCYILLRQSWDINQLMQAGSSDKNSACLDASTHGSKKYEMFMKTADMINEDILEDLESLPDDIPAKVWTYFRQTDTNSWRKLDNSPVEPPPEPFFSNPNKGCVRVNGGQLQPYDCASPLKPLCKLDLNNPQGGSPPTTTTASPTTTASTTTTIATTTSPTTTTIATTTPATTIASPTTTTIITTTNPTTTTTDPTTTTTSESTTKTTTAAAITSESVQTTIIDSTIENGDIQITKGNKIDVIPLRKTAWFISFDFKQLPVPSNWTNLIRFTAGAQDKDEERDRQPAVFMYKNQMKFCIGLDNKPGECSPQSEELPFNQWHAIEIKQEFIDSKYMFTVHINGVEFYSAENQSPKRYANVTVYASDVFRNPTNGLIRNLTYYNLPEAPTTTAGPTTTPSLFTDAQDLVRNNLIDTIPTWKFAWFISFNIQLIGITTETNWGSVLKFTNDPDADLRVIGGRIPALFVKKDTTDLLIATGLNDDPNYWVNLITLTLNQWVAMEIKQIKEGEKYYFIVNVDGQEVEKVENTKPRIFSDVKVYLSDDLFDPAKARIQNLTYYNLPEDDAEPTRNSLIGIIPVWKPAWFISFNVQPMETLTTWGNILRFTTGTHNTRQMGDRQPAIFLKDHTNQLHTCIGLNDNRNYCFTSKEKLELGEWYSIELSQIKQGSKYVYFARINGKIIHQMINENPLTFENVHVYRSDDFYEPAKVLLRDLVYYNLPEDHCHLPNAPVGAVRLGTKCIMVMDLESFGLIYNGEGITYCAEKYGGEMITINSLEEFNQLTDYLKPGTFLAAASDREEEGVLKWQDSKMFS